MSSISHSGEGWRVFQGDCLGARLPNTAQLIYLDPPFACESEDSYYGVGKTQEEYLQYVLTRVSSLVGELSGFNLVLHVDWKSSHYLKVGVDKILGRDCFRNEIVWAWSGPSVASRHLPRKHDSLLWWGVGDYPFNLQYIPYRGLSLGGKASWGTALEDPQQHREDLLSRGKALEDWWVDIPPLIRSESEKVHYPTQKPLRLLERVVAFFSSPGGLVVDPMMGSGTTGVAALRSGRDFVGYDLSEEALRKAIPRLKDSELPFWLRP